MRLLIRAYDEQDNKILIDLKIFINGKINYSLNIIDFSDKIN